MTNLLIYPCMSVTTLAWVFYSKYQFDEFNGLSKRKWHPFGALYRFMYFATILVLYIWPTTWQDICLAGAFSVAIFEHGINLFALKHVGFFYEGKTSKFDTLKKFKWFIVYGLLIACIALKIFVH